MNDKFSQESSNNLQFKVPESSLQLVERFKYSDIPEISSQELRPVGLVHSRSKEPVGSQEHLPNVWTHICLSVCMCEECLMLNRVEKLLKTHRMESLAYFVRPPVLDTNTKVSQKLIGTDEEEMVMIKQ